MTTVFRHILIIADIEGSSGCFSYQASRFLTTEWAEACLAMSRDVAAIARALYQADVGLVTVKDFHRTAYNLLPELLDPRVRLDQGYRIGPVPGLGHLDGADAAMFIGQHAPSGSTGFLPHTLTSRIKDLKVNGQPMSEVQLLAALMAPYEVRPIFFSGCPVACDQISGAMPNLTCYPIDKSNGPERFAAEGWRTGLADAAERSLGNCPDPYRLDGPFEVTVTIRDGPVAADRIARRWSWTFEGDRIFIESPDVKALYADLCRLAYLTPLTDRLIRPALFGYGLMGRLGLAWVRWKTAGRRGG